MSRGRNPDKAQYKQISFSVDPELARLVDETMISFGLDNRGDTMRMILRAWLSMVPIDTTVYEVCQIAVKQMREAEFAALAKHYEDRSKMYREGRP